jgi:hypothetical protein
MMILITRKERNVALITVLLLEIHFHLTPQDQDVLKSILFDKPENFDPSKKLTKVDAQTSPLLICRENDQGLVREAIYIKDRSFFNC